ncbi:MAG: LysE family transporter [Bacteroidetes bacterium]|nr:LysE family transporter [Bacteroidota bacterium]MDA1119415.1 LysE family transporter [Bacteroidota bacterium]
MAFIKGLLFGMGLMLAMGPVFFTVVQTSLQRGFKTAAMVAIGVMLSDVFYISLAFFGLSKIDSDEFRVFLGLCGGVIMLIYGLVLISKKVEKSKIDLLEDDNILKYLAKGWLINFLNPFIPIFWIGVVGIAQINYGKESIENFFFFSGIVVMVYSSDILKSFLANRLRTVVTPALILNLNKALGFILIAFGIWLFSNALGLHLPQTI